MTTTESNDVAARIRASEQQFQEMLVKAALAGSSDAVHEDVYFVVQDGQIQTIGGSDGNAVVSHCTFRETFPSEVEGETEAVIDVDRFFDYLSISANGGMVDLKFRGEGNSGLAQEAIIDSKLKSSFALPGGRATLDSMPLQTPDMFNGDEEPVNAETGNIMPVTIETAISELGSINGVKSLIESVDSYPIVVEDGNFRLDVNSETNETVSGLLEGAVEGPDVNNEYNRGFEELVSSLSGEVSLYTVPDGPLCAIQTREDYVNRHILGNLG